ncbi:MAG: S1/P1 nuclease [Pseudomonadales bacterium]|jgi:hypothetical protein|nr:S1/P1 nuclease [Pseudomonadales bacterium]
MRRLIAVLLLCLSALPASSALAWGQRGHRIIGHLAERHLSAASQAAVRTLLDGDDLATASTWADTMRNATDNPEFWNRYASTWHYVNLPKGVNHYAAAPHDNDTGDALQALAAFSAILRDAPVPAGPVRKGLEFYFGDLRRDPRAVKAFALRFMIHILGDLQQPLHCGYAEDRGGNRVPLTWFGHPTNLHTVWDSLLVENAQLSDTAYANRLERRIAQTPLSDLRQMEQGDPQQWLNDARALLDRLYARHSQNPALNGAYAAEFTPAMELQLERGGLRTATVLNRLFGGGR